MSLVANNLSIKINNRVLLQNANLCCEPGKIVALCGPNGAGKSTLLKVISGDLAYNQGSVSYNGSCLKSMNSKTLALHRAVMPQSLELNFNFTAQQVIEMALLFTPSCEQQSIIDEVSELLALENLLHKAYPQLSGGEKQRVQLARVIAQLLQKAAVKPAYLLLDEATSAMDLAMMHQAFALLKKITEKHIGVVAVVHDLNLASHYADEIVLISGQSTSHVGKPKDIVTEENIADVFSANIAVLEHPTLKHPVILYQ